MLRSGKRTISSLPTELLGLIITHVSLVEPSAPLRLARVSRIFYRVSMSTPGAWTTLLLRLPNSSHTHAVDSEAVSWSAVRKAKMWFQRSGACSVDVMVEMEQNLSPFSSTTLATLATVLDLGADGETDVTMNEGWGILLLPHALSRFSHRIRSLKLHTTTPEEARAFVDTVYPPAPLALGPYDLPLQELILVAANDGTVHAPANTHLDRIPSLKIRPPPGTINNVLCRNKFSHLEHLTFVNHPVPLSLISDSSSEPVSSSMPPLPRLLSAETGHRLRSLCITYPVRFAPILLPALLDALRVTLGLEKLEVEGRVNLGDISHQHQGHGVAPGPAHGGPSSVPSSVADQTSMLPSSSTAMHTSSSTLASPSSVAPLSSSSPTTSLHIGSPTPSQMHSRPLLALPCLTLLALKTNNLPAILSFLVLPALHELRIEDMDAKRQGAAHETAEALRGLIVRGEMPLDSVYGDGETSSDEKSSANTRRHAKGGLEVLDMSSIALRHPRGIGAVPIGAGTSVSHPSSQTWAHRNSPHPTYHNVSEDDAAAALWRWCFRRMSHLRELRVAKMDVDVLLGYITPPSSRSSQSPSPRPTDSGFLPEESILREQETFRETVSGVDAEVLPRLKRLVIADYGPVTAAWSSTPGSMYALSPPARNVKNLDNSFVSASIRVFKTRRPDVVIENV